MNAATDLEIMSPQYMFPDKIYFGANKLNNTVERYSDVNIYELSVYTRSLNDMQISINGKNAKFIDVDDYKNWKEKNFISANELDPRIPESVFFSNGKYITEFDTQQINNIAARSKIPTLYLNFPESSRFTSEYFYAKQTSSALTFDATATYYDPVSRRDATFKVRVSLQGTSTLGYRIKNLEMYVNETFVRDGETYVKLFQPKKEWLPESQFTLKADVVDSAHANNAILGEWINTSGVFKNNPAMDNYIENRPQDWDDAYSAATTDAERRAHTYTDDPEVATIKHTLEGFPYLMFIKFSDKSSYTFLGIYSFNLGRYSYYNMGMKFLKGYSRRDGATKVACPKIINYYEEMPTLGNISASDVFSFEMGNAGNLKIADYPVWSQYDRTVVQSYGSFRYLGSPESEGTAWTNLCALFEAIARFRITAYNGDLYPAYDNIKYYTIDAAGHYQTTGEVIGQDNESNTQIVERLSIENAAAYFIVANAFGMTDSLGKNLTIRTWDGGRKWWFCFYDMDTALALANDGSEGNPVTIAIDKITMRTDPTTSASILETTYHDNDSKYAAVLSKIWGIFRDDRFLYLQNQGKLLEQRYEYIWNSLRSSTGKLSTSENFTNIMAERVDACGEMIYNYDYNTKYIQDTAAQEGGAAAAITFLHGTRVEYVRDWLRKHFYFLDGMFDYANISKDNPFSYTDSPYNSDIVTFVANYSSAIPVLPFTVQVSAPSFIGINVGSDPYKKYYIDTENVDTTIYFVNGTSSNSQLNIRGSSTISKLFGLQGGFQAIQSNNETGVTKTLSTFDVSTSTSLNDDPFHNNIFGVAGESSLESIDLSGTRGITTLSKYEVDLSICQKLIDVNISNSDVTALVLPNTSLQRLNVANSNIANFTLSNQSVLTSINLDGCNRLNTVDINNCSEITALNILNKPNLSSIRISNCSSLSSVTISDNNVLTSVSILNNANLKSITIKNCNSKELLITILGSQLEEIIISNLDTENVITLPERQLLANVTLLDLRENYFLSGIKYGSEELPTYHGETLYDFSCLTSLNGNNLYLKNVNGIKYIKVPNIENSPFDINRASIDGCNNIRRIIGHIRINTNSVFKDKREFYINELIEPVDGKTPFDYYYYTHFNDDDEWTNVTINTTDLSECFKNTKCNLSDVYYIFKNISGATNIREMFDGCTGILTDPDINILNENVFENCESVTQINGLFNGTKINGTYSDSTLLAPLVNITEFNNVFGGCSIYLMDETVFFPSNNKIETIVGFSPIPYSSKFFDETLLRNLRKLRLISDSFNAGGINFGDDGDSDIFEDTVLLESIDRSFVDISGYGSLKNIFGGIYDGESHEKFSNVLSSITHSFYFNDSSLHTPTSEEDDGYGILMPIGNSLFKKIQGSLTYITGYLPGENASYDFGTNSFCGRGIVKYIDIDDCDGELFPYKIFKDCINLREIPGFFNETDVRNSGSTISLPISENGTNLFGNCKSLQNISFIFKGMKNVNYRLVSNGFTNANIVNAESAFSEKTNVNCTKIGKIPDKLLYQEIEENYPIEVGLTVEQAVSYNIAQADGTIISNSGTLPDTENITTFNATYKKIKCTIENMQNIFENTTSIGIENYTIERRFENLFEDNENYNPLLFLLNGNDYYVNPNYDKYPKVWNKYAYDNSYTFKEDMGLGSTIEQTKEEYGDIVDFNNIPDIFLKDNDDPSRLYSELNKNHTGYDKEQYSELYRDVFCLPNYFCAPDLFRYCANSRRTNINGAFSNCTDISYIDANRKVGGIRGRIPHYLFDGLSEIIALKGIFYGDLFILPERWGKLVTDPETMITTVITGETFYSDLFKNCNSIENIESLFASTSIWGYTAIPSNLFSPFASSLINAGSLFASAIWKDIREWTEAIQIPVDTFFACRLLQDVSNMFNAAAVGGIRGIKSINSAMFSASRNPYINNCSYFLYSASEAHGSLPPFWDWITSRDYEKTYAGLTPEYIDNYEALSNAHPRYF